MIFLLRQVVLAVCLANLALCGTLIPAHFAATDEPGSEMAVEYGNGCPSVNPKYPVLLPHPGDCTKFYICDHGSRHQKTCQKGLHFNPKIQACDFPAKAGCDTVTTEKPKGRIIDDISLKCPAKNLEQPVLLPYPEDCGKYYNCENGVPRLQKCEKGLHFNPKIDACDYPQNAGCDSGIIENPKDRLIDPDLLKCPAGNSEEPILRPYPYDCGKYFTCDNGVPRLQKCPSRLHFNPKSGACDYPQNAGCASAATDRMAAPLSPHCPRRDGDYPVYFRDPTNCTVFYQCSNGRAYKFVCPAQLHFNVREKVCDYEMDAGCA